MCFSCWYVKDPPRKCDVFVSISMERAVHSDSSYFMMNIWRRRRRRKKRRNRRKNKRRRFGNCNDRDFDDHRCGWTCLACFETALTVLSATRLVAGVLFECWIFFGSGGSGDGTFFLSHQLERDELSRSNVFVSPFEHLRAAEDFPQNAANNNLNARVE